MTTPVDSHTALLKLAMLEHLRTPKRRYKVLQLGYRFLAGRLAACSLFIPAVVVDANKFHGYLGVVIQT